MGERHKMLLETKDLWIPALTALFARFSATRPGHSIERQIKDKLKWLKAPESENAFLEAFDEGVEKFSTQRGHLPEARAAVRILSANIRDETSPLSLPSLLEQIQEAKANEKTLLDAASQAVELEDALVPSKKVAAELKLLIEEFLHKAFLNSPYFTQRVGFSELILILKDIRAELANPGPDLEKLQREYLSKLAGKHDVIPMQGISPKIQNRTIGMRMEDIFIPLELTQDSSTTHTYFIDTDLGWLQSKVKATLESGKKSKLSALASPTTGLWEATASGLARFSLAEPKLSKKAQTVYSGTEIRAEILKTLTARTLKTPKPSKIEALLTSPRVVVKGNPGSGKSTLARYIAWALAKGKTEVVGTSVVARIPILIRAIDFGEALEQQKVGSLEEYLLTEADRFGPSIKRALVSGNALILIDGLDEVGKPALRARVKERTDDFIADPVFAANHVLVTTRIVGYERTGLTGRFQHFTITDLSKEQIQHFILNWYAAIERETPGSIDAKSESLQLNDAVNANDSIGKMARNPLLLTIIALIKWQGRTLPEQRVLLYDAAAQTLIKSWPLTQRKVEFDELFIREWLAPIALHILADRTGDLIDEYSLTTELSKIMQQLKSMTEIQAKSATRELLDNISEHSGFLLPRDTDKDGNNLYGFLHQTFAEYLAAYHLVGRWEDDHLELGKYAHDPYWREVFLLMAGHLGTQRRAKAGKFIEAVRKLNSSPYEHIVHRDLLLACQILTDGTPVGPAGIVESLLSDLLKLWKETSISPLRSDIDSVFKKLRETEYAEVLARLATTQMSPHEIAQLAGTLGARLLSEPLIKVLNAAEPDLRLAAAQLLLESHRQQSLDVALELAGSQELFARTSAVILLINAEDTRAVPFLLDLLRAPDSWDDFRDLKIPKNPTIPDAVAALLIDDDYETRGNAAALLAHWRDPRGVPAFVSLINSDKAGVPSGFFALLNEMELFDPQSLHQLLGSDNPSVQLFVGFELVRRNDPSGIDALLKADTQEQTGYAPQVIAMSLASSEIPAATAALRGRLEDPNPKKRLLTASALANKGNQPAIDVLSTFLQSDDPETRLISAEGLVNNPKVDLLNHIDWLLASAPEKKEVDFQNRAVAILSKLKGNNALVRLIALLDDKRPTVRRRAADILALRDEPQAIEAMKSHLTEFTKELNSSAGLPSQTPLTTRALANSGYEFLKRHLTPNGELKAVTT